MGNLNVKPIFRGVVFGFGICVVLLSLLAHTLSATSAAASQNPLRFSELEGRYTLIDIRDSPTYAAGIVYDPIECGHTELFDIDNDLKLISDAHFNLVRLKTGNKLEETEKILATAEKYYPELVFIVSFKPYQYSTDVQRGGGFPGQKREY